MGDVISYVSFVNKAMKDELSQEDARHLLVIEMTRLNGKPRRKLITRLLNMSYADERAKVLTVLDRLNPEE